MRITIVASGTRGDVQPVLAFSLGLRQAGHSVRIVAGSNFEAWIRSYGFDFVPSVDMEALMQSEAGVRWSQSSDSPMRQLKLMQQLLIENQEALLSPMMTLQEDTDLLVAGFTSESFVQAVSEAHGIPYINAFLQPYTPTRSGPASLNAIIKNRNSLLNLAIGKVAPRLVWSISAIPTNVLRGRLGLKPHTAGSYMRRVQDKPVLYGFSKHVVPRPADWQPNKVITGYWFLDESHNWQPSVSLTAFLEAGPPPVYIGFGSMSSSDPQATARLIAAAVAQSGQRAIVGSGWGRLENFDAAHIHVLDHAPHHWLFERVAGVVHHGGAGTTAAGLRAGRPTMIVPHMADQPFWGQRVHGLGVGVAPVPRHKLTVERLAEGIQQLVGSQRLQTVAAVLGEKLRAEDGVRAAVDAFEGWRFAG